MKIKSCYYYGKKNSLTEATCHRKNNCWHRTYSSTIVGQLITQRHCLQLRFEPEPAPSF